MNDAVRAILSLPEGFVPAPPENRIRSMVDHFAELFALYEKIAAAKSNKTQAA